MAVNTARVALSERSSAARAARAAASARCVLAEVRMGIAARHLVFDLDGVRASPERESSNKPRVA
jgi:hypothetical protein